MLIIGNENVDGYRNSILDYCNCKLSWLDGQQDIPDLTWDQVCRIGMIRAGKDSQTEVMAYDGQLLYAVAYISRVTNPGILGSLKVRPGEIVYSIEVAFADTES